MNIHFSASPFSAYPGKSKLTASTDRGDVPLHYMAHLDILVTEYTEHEVINIGSSSWIMNDDDVSFIILRLTGLSLNDIVELKRSM